jgi:hypothetical protein
VARRAPWRQDQPMEVTMKEPDHAF